MHKPFIAIKCLSIILITSAIGLELWHLSAVLSLSQTQPLLHPIFWVERFALVIHFIEGMIAMVFAPRKQQAPIPSGIYTFFVGTIGLVELFVVNDVMVKSNHEQ